MKKLKILLVSLSLIAIAILGVSTVYAKYVIEESTIAAKLNIDRTKPVGNVIYSETTATKENVIVTVYLSEKIQNIDGWEMAEDGLSMTKIYEQNSTEQIKIVDLSDNENVVEVNVQNIDKEAPTISIISVENTNTKHKDYASKIHTITAKIKITDMQINSDVDISKINVFVGEEENKCTKLIKNINKTQSEITFDLVLTNIEENGNLSLQFPSNFIVDVAGNSSNETNFSTNITIDNISPKGAYSQEALESGKVRAKITASEVIENLNNWDTSDNKIFIKDFPANVSYNIEISDYAQNTAVVEINVTGATYIILEYASHNSMIGWTYGWGNYDIAGKNAVKQNSAYKTEALAFRITGKVPTNFVKIKGYVNSYWNNSCDYGKCSVTGYKYKLGDVGELSMASSNLSTLNGKKYMQLGGGGINTRNMRDYNGNNPIPYSVIHDGSNNEYPFGVSRIQISLGDYSELSVAYQILVNGKGWLKTATNGEATSAGKTLPMSAIRVAILPTSELENLVKLWNKDVGTYNVD